MADFTAFLAAASLDGADICSVKSFSKTSDPSMCGLLVVKIYQTLSFLRGAGFFCLYTKDDGHSLLRAISRFRCLE
jgi:hypothetical protein